jgi:6-phosphogluconate dehydrogenase (decarboxylating)
MQIGLIGLGRMGSNMVRRMMKAGHECVVYNRSPGPVEAPSAPAVLRSWWRNSQRRALSG